MAEKSQYVPTAIIPNIAVSLADDIADETNAVNYMHWPFKPILLFGIESMAGNIEVFRA